MSRLGLQKTGERRRRRRRKAPHVSISLLLELREEDEMWRSAPLLQLLSTNILLRVEEEEEEEGGKRHGLGLGSSGPRQTPSIKHGSARFLFFFSYCESS